ncbi:hypothetical protein JXA40_06340 [bacterium]|nr:hypothetical protein [candidate division CSSED10-310 bacterium]
MKNNRISSLLIHPVLAAGIAVLSGILALYIWERTGIPELKAGKWIWCSLYPLSIFGFSLLVSLMVRGDPRLYSHLEQDGWFSLTVIPFLLMLVSWSVWDRWEFMFSLFYFGWIVMRGWSSLLLLNRLSPKRQHHFAMVLYAFVAFILALFQLPSFPDIRSVIVLIGGWAAVVVLAGLIRKISAAVVASNKSDPGVSNGVGLLSILSLPLFTNLDSIRIEHFIGIAVLGFWLSLSLRGEQWLRIGYPAGIALLVLSSLSGPANWGIAIWAVMLIVVSGLKTRKHLAFLEITGSIAIVLGGVFGSVLIQNSMWLHNRFIWPVDIGAVLLAGLLDVKGGLLFASPSILFALTGLVWSFRRTGVQPFLLRLGFAAAILPVAAVSLYRTGEGPRMVELIPSAMMIWPFAAVFLAEAKKPFAFAWTRFILIVSFCVSGLFFAFMALRDAYEPTVLSLLARYGELSDLNLEKYFPIFNHLTAGWSFSSGIWLLVFGLGIAVVSVERWLVRRELNGHWGEIAFLVLTILLIGAAMAATRDIQQWTALPITREIILDQQQTEMVILVDEPDPVWGIELISWLSHSVHLTQEQPVGRMTAFFLDGHSSEIWIRAGVETAERVFGRMDVLREIRHHQPQVYSMERFEMDDGSHQVKFAYRSRWYLDRPGVLRRIEFQMDPALFPSNVSLSVKGVRIRRMDAAMNWGSPQPVNLSQNLILDTANPEFATDLSGMPLVRKIRIVSNLSNAAEVPDGVAIARLEITGRSGVKIVHHLRIGADTSEWAYDRPDLIGKVRHSKASVAMSKRQQDAWDRVFLSHTYAATKTIHPPIAPAGIRIRYALPPSICPNGQLAIYSITFL